MNPIVKQYSDLVGKSLPKPPYPVISTGVCGFMVLTWLATFFNNNIINNWSFSPNCLLNNFETYRFNTFPLVHLNFLHLFFNLITLYYPLSEFEKSHGSLHTAIILNTLGAVTAIAYTITSYILVYLNLSDENILNISILGSSGWVFTFLTVHCCYRSINQSLILINHFNINIPTLYLPLIYLLVSSILIPNSSFIGHLISIVLGVLIFKKVVSLITIPPFNILDKIDNLKIFKNAIEIIFPSEIFVWTSESSVKSSRYSNSNFVTSELPLHHQQIDQQIPTPSFEGTGDKLGSNL